MLLGMECLGLQVDRWVLSTLMNASMASNFPGQTFYDPTKSKTYTAVQGSTYDCTYDVGEVFSSGVVGTDKITISGESIVMPFGLSTACSATRMIDAPYDVGLIGLGFGTKNTIVPNPGPTFMEAIQSQLDSPVFTFNLPETANVAGDFIEFGRVDKSLYDGSLQDIVIFNQTTPQHPDFYNWNSQLSYSLNGKNVSSELQQALFDTGGMGATAHPDVVSAYWGSVKGAKDLSSDGTGWAFPCSGTNLSDLTYNFIAPGGKTSSATVPGKFFNSTMAASGDTTGTMCQGGLQSDHGNKGTVGYAFFHAFFTVFDQSKPLISFAPYPKAELDGVVVNPSGAPAPTSAIAVVVSTVSGKVVSVTPTESAQKTLQLGGNATATGNGTVSATGSGSGIPTATGSAAISGATSGQASGATATGSAGGPGHAIAAGFGLINVNAATNSFGGIGQWTFVALLGSAAVMW